MSAKPSTAMSPTFESIQTSPWWQSLCSAQFADIRFIAGAGVVLTAILAAIAFLICVTPWASEPGRLFLSAAGVIGSGTVAWSYDLANKRAGTIDMIASDIISIVRTVVALNVIGDFITKAKSFQADINKGSPSEATETASAAAAVARPGEDQTGPGFADTARHSDYLAVFHALIPDLRALDTGIVSDVTAFYTFFKGARDATESLARWKIDSGYQSKWKIHDIVAIMYAMSLSLTHGRCAIKFLVRDTETQQVADKIFKDLLVQSVDFLRKNLKDKKDPRRRLNLARSCELRAERKSQSLSARFARRLKSLRASAA